MRVTTLFKRLLGLERVRVVGVQVVGCGSDQALLVDVALPARRVLRCACCGARGRAAYDRRMRRLRHLDVARTPTFLRCEVRRLECARCGVVCEQLAFARPGSRFTRAFEDSCAWLARAAPKSVVARLLGIDWATVGRIIERVVGEARARADGDGLDGLRRIGIDEVAYRKGHRYLLCVCDHDAGRIVWCAQGRSKEVLRGFFAALGAARTAQLEAVSLDMSEAFNQVVAQAAPQAAICIDPFHVAAQAQFALDRVRAGEWQRLRASDAATARWLKGTRWAVRRGPANRTPADQQLLTELAAANAQTYHAWLLCEQLRAVFHQANPTHAADLLDSWCRAAAASKLPRFDHVAAMLTRYRTGILNSIRLTLSNARLEAMNSTIRLLSHRARGFRRIDSLIALIHLVCGRIPVHLPT